MSDGRRSLADLREEMRAVARAPAASGVTASAPLRGQAPAGLEQSRSPTGAWQPIETAPKDGTQFLALLSNGWFELLRDRRTEDWPFQWYTSLGRMSIPIVETHAADTDWKQYHTILATHWMPLPEPPNG